MKICHAYVRVSSDKQENSLDAQTIALKQLYKARYSDHYEWRGVYADADFSGTLAWFSRPAGRKLLQSLSPGDVILATKLDRFSRNNLDWHTLVKQVLPGLQVDLKVGDLELELSTPSGRFMAATLINFAEYERDQIAERTKTVLRYKQNELREYVGRVPKGWKVNRHGKLIPDQEHRAEMARILAHQEATGLDTYALWRKFYRHEKRCKKHNWEYVTLWRNLQAARNGYPIPDNAKPFTHQAWLASRSGHSE